MNTDLLQILEKITKEEELILSGRNSVVKNLYTTKKDFIIDSKKMLEKGKLIDVRTHTRFTHFPKHKHNFVEIIYMCKGSTTHIINDISQVVLEEGDLLFLNQNAYQEILPAGEQDIAINFIVLPEFFDVAFSMLKGENMLKDFIVDSLRQDTGKSSYLHFKVANILPIQNLIENMIWSLMNKQPNNHKINQTTMGLLFLQLLNYTDKIEQSKNDPYDNYMTLSVLRYIEENYREASLTKLAEDLNQSVYSLSKLIKRNTGHTYKELLQVKRFNKAVELLTNTELSVSDIIAVVGYDNTSYFHRIFKEKYQMTPKQFRM
ncbi:helix-turn-helix domain-containing protein [Anaerocolumna sedimenticola]|uniref:Helix-turn-helix domain-containing protein n=1 Tax=Anaerocolumna sedimenticola TaxID=2696063 RepID=A0A6P1TLE3_9FIRM|nr:AraC family transcriptional regulator [Anaerocolumna sedimenticola]QHQ61864.1 helix-turn-helix domain-containing protein [Anaerocolumna sedimenticola]